MTRRVKILDGSFVTELEKFGFDSKNCAPLWTFKAVLENIDMVEKVYAKYADTGVDFLTTNTYQSGNLFYSDRKLCEEKEAAKLARTVVGNRNITVLGSVGCYGASQANLSEYDGRYIGEDGIQAKMEYYYTEHFKYLAEAGIEVFLVETVPAAEEVEAILKAFEKFPKAELIVAFSMKEGGHLNHGESISEGAKVLGKSPKPVSIGINCTKKEYISDGLRGIRKSGVKFRDVLVYPNNFENAEVVYTQEQVDEWIDLGATVIGACCGTGSEYITQLIGLVTEQ